MLMLLTDADEGREALENVLRINPNYPGAAELLAQLRGSAATPSAEAQIDAVPLVPCPPRRRACLRRSSRSSNAAPALSAAATTRETAAVSARRSPEQYRSAGGGRCGRRHCAHPRDSDSCRSAVRSGNRRRRLNVAVSVESTPAEMLASDRRVDARNGSADGDRSGDTGSDPDRGAESPPTAPTLTLEATATEVVGA